MLVHASTLVCSLVVARCEGLELELFLYTYLCFDAAKTGCLPQGSCTEFLRPAHVIKLLRMSLYGLGRIVDMSLLPTALCNIIKLLLRYFFTFYSQGLSR